MNQWGERNVKKKNVEILHRAANRKFNSGVVGTNSENRFSALAECEFTGKLSARISRLPFARTYRFYIMCDDIIVLYDVYADDC